MLATVRRLHDDLRRLASLSERGGYLLGALWANAWIARVLLTAGRRREARALLEDVLRRGDAHGIGSVRDYVGRAGPEDPVAQLRARIAGVALERPRDAMRNRALDALLAAARGESAATDAAAGPLPDGPLHGLDHAILHLAAAVTARLAGDREAARVAYAAACDQAARDEVDREILDELLAVFGDAVASTRTGRTIDAAARMPADWLVVDARLHEVRGPRWRASLASRPTLARLLYALAAHCDRLVDKAELAGALYPGTYKPARHDPPLKMAIQRLRVALDGSGLAIVHSEGGYRLAAPDQFALLEPVVAPA